MTVHVDINDRVDCVGCTFADARGRSCKHGLLFPVDVMMGLIEGKMKRCPNYEKKTLEQMQERYEVEQQNKNNP